VKTMTASNRLAERITASLENGQHSTPVWVRVCHL
jgi:hypothetical protein